MTPASYTETITSVKKTIIGIQGAAGSYHESAARAHFGHVHEVRYLHNFTAIFNELSAGTITHGVVAIANNRYGFIPEAFRELMKRHGEVTITGEVYIPIRHQLLAKPGTKLSDITEIHSQAPALGQCFGFIEKNLPGAVLVENEDTALSAQLVSESAAGHMAAIASSAAAKLYGLSIIAPDIQDDENNVTRFYIMQPRGKAERVQDADKTTALLKVAQAAGSLVDALTPFKEERVNVSNLHSSFLPNTDFDMQFLIEFDLDIADSRMQSITQSLKNQNADLEILGSYRTSSLS